MTPAQEPGGRPRDPAVARLLRWYPRAWRQRYGEEFLAMVEDGLDGQRPTWRLTVSVAWAGLRERGRALVSGRALARGARGVDYLFARWWPSLAAACVLALLPAAAGASAPPGRAREVTAALDALVVVTAVTSLAVLAGGLVALPAFRTFLRIRRGGAGRGGLDRDIGHGLRQRHLDRRRSVLGSVAAPPGHRSGLDRRPVARADEAG